MNYKYKVGDKVIPKHNGRHDCSSMICYDPQMKIFENEIYEIESIYNERERTRPEYRLKDVWNFSHTWQWVWDESWLIPACTIEINQDYLKALFDGE